MINKKRMTKRLAMILMVAAVAMTTPVTMIAQAASISEENTDNNKKQKPEGEPPAKPDGEKPSGEKPEGEPPAKPDGEQNGEGGMQGGPVGGMQGGPGGGADTHNFDYSGTYTGALTADGQEVTSDGETVKADDADQNAALSQNGGTLTITNGTLKKSGSDSDGDKCNFYGVNSIALTVGEDSKTYISDTSLSADGTGSNGIFATDSGTVFANNVTISTTEDNSRGLDATYDGTIIGNELTINTDGNHCAAVATDRGGGNISVTNSTINTNGDGSPVLYSTGDIQVKNVTGTATGSQIAGMEGYNTIVISDSDLKSEITKASASDPVANGVIIYQSTSGDAETSTGETATFNAVDSTLTTTIEEGAFFYVTNTTGDIVLKNTTLVFDSTKANLLQIEGNDSNNWGSAGKNGGSVVFTAYDETLTGDISVDTISSLDFYLLDGSTYTGAMTIKENENGTTSESPIIVNISKGSKWIVTEDTTISGLNAEDGAEIVDENGKTVTIIADGQTVVSGDGGITVTVNGDYSNTVTTDEHNELTESYIDRSDFDSYYGTNTGFTNVSVDVTENKVNTTEAAEQTDTTLEANTKIGSVFTMVAMLAIPALIAGGLGIMSSKKKK
ncbi:MAG: adhesin [Lachnospiraceae bacterium]|nr:adhesin [Lachnospiraceae bacterium]